MTPDLAHINYNASNKLTEDNYFKDLSLWIRTLKPDAKAFGFDCHWESDDEGGSDPYFSELYIDDTTLEEIVRAENFNDIEFIKENFRLSKYRDLEEELLDPDSRWDNVRNYLEFPRFVYEHGKYTITE